MKITLVFVGMVLAVPITFAQLPADLLHSAYAERGIEVHSPELRLGDAPMREIRSVERVSWDPLRKESIIVFTRTSGNPVIALSKQKLPRFEASVMTQKSESPVLIKSGELCELRMDESAMSVRLRGIALQTVRNGESLTVRIDKMHQVHARAFAPGMATVVP